MPEEHEEEELPDMVFPNNDHCEPEVVDLTTARMPNSAEGQIEGLDMFINLTSESGPNNKSNACKVEENEVIMVNEDDYEQLPDYDVIPEPVIDRDDDIPDNMYWKRVLGALEQCTSYSELLNIAKEIQANLRPLPRRNMNVFFRPECDIIDSRATATLPQDGPTNVHSIWTNADGNCML